MVKQGCPFIHVCPIYLDTCDCPSSLIQLPSSAAGSPSAASHGSAWQRDCVEKPHLLGYSYATRSSLLCAPLGWLMKHNERGGRVRSERSTVSIRVLTGRVEQRSVSLNANYVLICTSQICRFGNQRLLSGYVLVNQLSQSREDAR